MSAKRVGLAGVALSAMMTLGAPLLLVLALTAFLPGGAGGLAVIPPAVASPTSAVADIPLDYLADFRAAGARWGVPWELLAGIYKVECDFGRSPLAGCQPRGSENPVGAQGPGQFLPGTWRRGLGPHQVIPVGPPTASNADGYATDGNGDGQADPWDPADAIASSARLLAAAGAPAGNLTGAVFAYNHDPTYVRKVLALASSYGPGDFTGAVVTGVLGGAGATTGPAAGIDAVLAFARAQLGKPYLWGGAGPDAWDCSGLVEIAYHQAGVSLSHNAAAQYAATANTAVPLGELRPGDLVFFGRSAASIHHVGISLGGTTMLDAPHTGAVVRIESIGWSDLYAATRPLSR